MGINQREKSNIALSAALNIIRKACMIAFPLISYSYAARVLGTGGIGIYEFSLSIVNYFALIAALGITNYAVRDGAHLLGEENREELNSFASEIFSINLVMTAIAYVILIGAVSFIPTLQSYKVAIMISSLSILFTTIGVDWINSLFEDYLYLTIRYIAVQIIAIILLFIVVNGPDDVYWYIAISIMATVVNGIMNIIYIRKYVSLRFTYRLNLAEHMLPIFILFCNNIASVIYLNSDVTILGIMTDDDNVGLYGVASKIYMMIKELMNAAIFVTIPRFSLYVSKEVNSGDNHRYMEGLKNLLTPLLVVLMPACVGLGILADNVIDIIAGAEFAGGVIALRILAVAMFFAVMACFLAYAIIMPYKLEKYFLASTTLAALVNIALNVVAIPMIGMPAVAITTLIAEIMVFTILLVIASKKVAVIKLLSARDVVTSIIGSVVVALTCVVCEAVGANAINAGSSDFLRGLFTIGTVVLAVCMYVVILVVTKNSVVELVKGVLRRQ